jgi:ribosomal-protein-alanine N-acetyltransferase
MEFRRISINDVEELHQLLNNLTDRAKFFFHPHPFDKEIIEEICLSTNEDHYFVLTLDKKIVGYSMLRLFGHEIPSFGCCIGTGFEGKRLGSALTVWTVNRARDLGYKKIILKIHKDNTHAFQMYKRAGFVVTEILDEIIKMELNN